MLLGQELSDAYRFTALLLLSTILRDASQGRRELIEKALSSADTALGLAIKLDDPKMVGNAHFHRGVSFLHQNNIAAADFAFALSLNTDPLYGEWTSYLNYQI